MAGVVQRDWRFELRETLPDFFGPLPRARAMCLPDAAPAGAASSTGAASVMPGEARRASVWRTSI
jgi:hypothetical protein